MSAGPSVRRPTLAYLGVLQLGVQLANDFIAAYQCIVLLTPGSVELVEGYTNSFAQFSAVDAAVTAISLEPTTIDELELGIQVQKRRLSSIIPFTRHM
jgi:hypothetical protein